jgi:hypothetical protein
MDEAPFGEGRLWLAVGTWAAVAALLAVVFIEALLAPLQGQVVVHAIARTTAYLTAGLSMILFLSAAFAFALVMWASLRWIEVAASFGDVLETLAAGFWTLAVYAALAAGTLWLAPPAPGSADTFASWKAYREAFLAAEPMHVIWSGRTLASGAALLAVMVALKRRIGCAWLDAAIAVGAGATSVLLFSLVPRLLGIP